MLDGRARFSAQADPARASGPERAVLERLSRPIVRTRSRTRPTISCIYAAQLYARRFTDAELDQLIAFYSQRHRRRNISASAPASTDRKCDLASAWSSRRAHAPKIAKNAVQKLPGKGNAMKSAVIVFPASNCDRDAARSRWNR